MSAEAHQDCTCCRAWRSVEVPSAIDIAEARAAGRLVRIRPPELLPHEDIPQERALVRVAAC